MYLSTRSLFEASNQTVQTKHSSTLKNIAHIIEKRPNLFPHPWKVLCFGDSEEKNLKYINLPSNVKISTISSLASGEYGSFWDSFCLFLKTTRSRQIENLTKEWKKKNKRQRIPKKEKELIVRNHIPTSFLDVLYRLRVRSNYLDADSFLVAIESTEDAKKFNAALRRIAWYSMLYFELIIARYTGKVNFEKMVNDFTGRISSGFGTKLLKHRLNNIKNAI